MPMKKPRIYEKANKDPFIQDSPQGQDTRQHILIILYLPQGVAVSIFSDSLLALSVIGVGLRGIF